MRAALERYFEFSRLGTNWRTEILRRPDAFVTMAYIVFVETRVPFTAGMPFQSRGRRHLLLRRLRQHSLWGLSRATHRARPRHGPERLLHLHRRHKGMGVRWETALGAVFISGVAFLTPHRVIGIRELIFNAIPPELFVAVAAGIGLFIAVIGL